MERLAGLTERQIEYVRLVAAGLTDRQIADQWGYAVATVRQLSVRAMWRARCATRAELAYLYGLAEGVNLAAAGEGIVDGGAGAVG